MFLPESTKEFLKDSFFFMKKSTKPSRKEYSQILRSVSFGFFVMGAISYIIKLVHIPINNIIVGGSS